MRRRPAAAAIVAGAVAVTLAALWYWHAGWRAPLVYQGDAFLYQRLAKTMAERGWYLTNPRLGAPGGQALYDYPLGSDILHLGVFRVLAVVTSNPFVIVNAFYYLTFPLVFLASCYALRRLGAALYLAVPLAMVYALAPFHFTRNVTHLFLSGYYAVPLACLLLYELLAEVEEGGEEAEATDASEPRPETWSLRRFVRTRAFWLGRWLWVPVVLASAGAYYAFFFVMLAGAIGLLGALYRRDLRLLRRPALVIGITLAVLFVNNLPTFLYRLDHGANPVVADRELGESDISALQWSHLLLPIDGHRFEPLADVRARLHGSISPLAAGEQDALGALAALGLVISIAALVVDRRSAAGPASLRRRSGVLNVLAILLGSAGGAALLLGMAGFVQLRAYARLTLFIGFFSLVALAAAVGPVLETVFRRRSRRASALAVAVLAVAPLLALLDQTPRTPPGRRADAAASTLDRRLVTRIERRLGAGAMVLQFPLLGFPEDAATFPPRTPALNAVVAGQEVYNGYELFRPSLYTDSLRWSYGRIQARPGDILPSLGGKPLDRLLPQTVAAGFQGIYMDRAGFPDYAFQLEAELTSRLGPPPLTTADGRALFFDLREYGRRWAAETPPGEVAELRRNARHPLELVWDERFAEPEGVGRFFPQLAGFTSGRVGTTGARLTVTNPTGSARVLELHATARPGTATPGQLTVSGAGPVQQFPVSPSGTAVVVKVPVPPGATRLTFGAGPPGSAFRLDDVWWEG